MAYQNVGTPRFYISYGDYFKSLGNYINPINLLNPSQRGYSEIASQGDEWEIFDAGVRSNMPGNINKGANFWFCLGHNLGHQQSTRYDIICKRYQNTGSTVYQDFHTGMGTQSVSINYPIEHNGWSMRVGDNEGWSTDFDNAYNEEIHLGFRTQHGATFDGAMHDKGFSCMVYGRKYDMPHSPDLNLKMSVEMDGIKNYKNKAGISHQDINYVGPPAWGTGLLKGLWYGEWQHYGQHIPAMGAWQIEGGTNLRHGRRIWELSFTSMLDSTLMPKNISPTSFGHSSDEHLGMVGDDSFIGSVLTKTLGGNLKFIFQPDNTNFNPDQFAICKFDMNSFKFNQVAKNVYDISLKIRETW